MKASMNMILNVSSLDSNEIYHMTLQIKNFSKKHTHFDNYT